MPWPRSRHGSRSSPPKDWDAQGAIAPFDLTIHEGEVVGLAGLLGSGRTELARLLFVADKPDSGRLLVNGAPISTRHAPLGHRERHRVLPGGPQGRGPDR